MALESSGSWITPEQHKSSEQQLFVTEQVHSQPAPTKVMNKQHTQTERFTQTEYRGNCVEGGTAISHKESIMFEHAIPQHQPQAVPVQMYSTIEKKDIAQDKGTNIEFPFCYNVNMLQKVHQTQAGSQTATAVASITTDDKTCYRFDVAQPFGYNYALVNQMSLAAAASTATFKCDVCGLVFTHLSLLNHHKRIHTDNSNISPERTFTSEEPGEIKVQIKTTTKSRSCNRCGGEINCDHEDGTRKKGSKFVKCENCQACPTSTTTITTTNGSFQSSSSSPEPAESSPEIINISNKGLRIVKRQGLATVTKCHKCNGSGLIFVGGARSPPTDKPFRCNVCDGSFSRYSSLWSHKRLHTGDKPFKCEMCGLTFARAAYLKNHVRVHSGEKPYKCNICGMQFSQSPHLKNHERIHSGEKPYQCEVCEKTFARHSTLWNHRRIHTGEKPYRCTICGSAFNQATHLKNHAKVHTGEKPHRCDICDVGFSDRFALKRHKLIHDKYNRVSPNNSQTQSQSPQHSVNPQNQQSPAQIGEIYKCDVAFPGQQPSATATAQQQSQQSAQDEMYKCETSSVPFSVNQGALQSNPTRPSQQQTIYKCDAATSVSFPIQQQKTQQPAQSNSSSSTSQGPLTSKYKADGINNGPYQNQQSSQQQSSSNSVSQQQSNQVNEIYKFDNTSVAFPGQPQQSQTTSQQSEASVSSQQITQFDAGTSTVAFSGQAQQSQQTAQQTPAATPQQIIQMGSTYTHKHNSESILGP